MSTCCQKLSFQPDIDDENKALSQPLKFIGLPFYCVLLFILYWFIYCPLMFVKVYQYYALDATDAWPPEWPYYFWTIALLIFLLMVSSLVILWKWSPKRDTDLYEVNYVEGDKVSLTPDLNNKHHNNFQANSDIKKPKDETEMKPMLPKTPLKLDLTPKDDQKIETANQNLTTPLSPREIFFHDLIESANKSFNSSTTIGNRKSEPESAQEFFIASVSPSKTCVSNVFMFVNPDDLPKEQNPEQKVVKDVQYL